MDVFPCSRKLWTTLRSTQLSFSATLRMRFWLSARTTRPSSRRCYSPFTANRFINSSSGKMTDNLPLKLGTPPSDQVIPPRVATQAKLHDVYGLSAEHANYANQRFRYTTATSDLIISKLDALQAQIKQLYDHQSKLLQDNSQALAHLLEADRGSTYIRGFNTGYRTAESRSRPTSHSVLQAHSAHNGPIRHPENDSQRRFSDFHSDHFNYSPASSGYASFLDHGIAHSTTQNGTNADYVQSSTLGFHNTPSGGC